MHADYLRGMPVLLSFATYSKFLNSYVASFDRVLIDSGAFSELNSGTKIDGGAYKDWCARWIGNVDAIAGLDDISGDWRKSLDNYDRFGGFPTFHNTDPPELLDNLIHLARERGGWIGLGLMPPRRGKEEWIRRVCDRIPKDIHIHGWALREYTQISRLSSVDSTNWIRDSWKYKNMLPFLTPAECVELVVKRYQRWRRIVSDGDRSGYLFDSKETEL